jgi:hypothetical protein
MYIFLNITNICKSRGQGYKDAPGILQFLCAASYLRVSVACKNNKLLRIVVMTVFILTIEHAKYAFKSHRNLLIPKYDRLHRSVPTMLRCETCLTESSPVRIIL